MPTWDEAKRLRNLRVHGLDFVEAEAIWDDFTVTLEDLRADYGEQRWMVIGVLRAQLVTLIYTERNGDDRYVSLRRANKYETTYYDETAYGRG